MATANPQPIVAIAAESREFSGLLRRAQQTEKLDWPVDFARRIQIDGQPWILVANGPGPKLAMKGLEQALRCGKPHAIVSTGFCGALDPSLQVGDLFAATEVRSMSAIFSTRLPSAPVPHRIGPLLSIDRFAATIEEKAQLHRHGVEAVEMEAAGVAELAQRSAAPFYCLRVVSDSAGENMPLDFNRYRDSKGRFSRSRIAAAAMFRPSSISPLLTFDSACRRASNILGDFLAECRF